jgi:hypothetical protein
MTMCEATTPTDPRISEDQQDLAELIEGTIELAISIFSFSFDAMTHLDEAAPSTPFQ